MNIFTENTVVIRLLLVHLISYLQSYFLMILNRKSVYLFISDRTNLEFHGNTLE